MARAEPQTLTVSALLAWARVDRLDEPGARDVTRFLRRRGLRATPTLFAVLAEKGEARWTEAYDSPGLVTDPASDAATKIAISRTRAPALLGILLTVLLLGAMVWYRWPPYGVVALISGALSFAVVWRGFEALGRRLPAAMPRSAPLGAAVATTTLAAALVIFILARRLLGL